MSQQTASPFVASASTIDRRPLKYADLDAMIADIGRLRRGYTKAGNWSLGQIAYHINLAFPTPLVAHDSQPQLSEAQVARQQRWDYYIANGHPPAGFIAPPELVPPESANEADVDALVQRLHDLKSFEGAFVQAAAGVMPIARARGFMLAHGAWHLARLHPTARKREHLTFASEQGVIADLKRLRGGYIAAGNWTLAQIGYHLAITTPYPPTAADAGAALTPEQQQAQRFLESVLKNGGPPPGFQAPPQIVPPASCDDGTVDELIKRLEALAAFDAPTIQMGSFGPVATAKCRQMVLGHASHHLAFLRPIKGPRQGLRFADENAAIADIRQLRLGYEQIGGWSLPQICWHLDQTMQSRMKPGPFPADTEEQKARRPILDRVLATGELPKGIVAPQPLTPPPGLGDAAIDACLATLERLRDFLGPITPHRIFGTMPDDVARKQNLIHVAHHLSHLIPISASRGEGQGASG